jgi:predicted Holliday junction resolvase-like endonuclease
VATCFHAAVLILIVILLAIAVAVLARPVVNLQRGLDRADARQKAAVNTSRSVHVSKIAEQLAPLLPGFPYSPKDVQWVGGTIDAIVWDGLEEKRDDLDIVFPDVKTGQARLNDRQRRIQDAAKAGRCASRYSGQRLGSFRMLLTSRWLKFLRSRR